MKILIVYATAGLGHRKAAEAIYNEARNKNLDVKIVDILDYTNPIFKCFYSHAYIFLIRHLPSVWKIAFHKTNNFKEGIFKKIVRFLNRSNTVKFIKFLEKEKFNLVISTQFMATEVTSCIAKKLNIKLINVITDFYPHSFWFQPHVHKYFVASDNTKQELVLHGVSASDIKISGIPIDSKFLQHTNREHLSKRLGVKPDLFSVLVMTGTIGMGPIEEIIDILKPTTQIDTDSLQLLVVCGANKKLYRSLMRKRQPNLRIFGLVNNVYELMSVSDLIITKPGGLSISEALSKKLPMIFFSIIPGQEASNARIIQDYGAGIILENVNKIRDIILELKASQQKLEEHKQKAQQLSHPNSASDILDTSVHL